MTGENDGGCACGAVRFVAIGAPLRAGLCHCRTCQKAHAAPCYPFAVFPISKVHLRGPVRSWSSSPGYDRRFCAMCGSRVAGVLAEEIELSLVQFDQSDLIEPQYESWAGKRARWMQALDLPQYDQNREAPDLCVLRPALSDPAR
ncbi:GFA family protein [Sphingomonas crocodyli]|uniref:GFA family protein n=1 Tax=Sphingomonas crocodyli TaxID=1979270 RepID=A0A437LYE5_9SPHN|nr:GFA family protein [Sphingomonas crocodyli]RVT90430.1 GFA family protein [Sphingomonas crocodyli]